MIPVLSAGMVIGAIFGLLHANYVYRAVSVSAGAANHARACYYALWTFCLWLLLGPYVLVLWVISVVAYAVARLFRWRM